MRAAYALLWFVAPYYVLTSQASNVALRGYFERLRNVATKAPRVSRLHSYLAFGRTLIDKAAVRGGQADRFSFTMHGEEHLRAMAAAGRGGLVISAHVGNWELASHMLRERDLKVSVVMQDTEDAAIKRVLDEAAGGRAVEIILLGNGLDHLFRIRAALDAGRILCFNGDRHLPGSRTISGSFLGEAALFPAGAFAIAHTLQGAVSFSFVLPTAPMHYQFTATAPLPPGTSVRELFERYRSELERMVIAHPLMWFNYFDFWHDGGSPSTGRT